MNKENRLVSIIVRTKDRPKLFKRALQSIADQTEMKKILSDWILLDDLNGRRVAKAMGFPVVGTLGVLVAAKRKGMIPKLSPVLDSLKKHRFYINEI